MANEIEQADIRKLSLKNFGKEIKINNNGSFQKLKGDSLKKYFISKVKGGKTVTRLEKELYNAGVKSAQMDKRKAYIKLIKGAIGADRKVKKDHFVKKSQRALDAPELPEEIAARQAKTERNIERAQSRYDSVRPQAGPKVSALGGGQESVTGQVGNFNANPLTKSMPSSGIGGGGRPFIPLQK